jgi:GTP-binding protein Era
MAKHVTHRPTPAFLVINKTDKVHKPDLLPLIDSYSRGYPFKEIFPISARKQVGTSELLASVIGMLPEHPPFYPLDIVGEQSERFFVSEIVREKIFLLCKEEIPYSTTVDVVEFREKEEGKTLIEAEIYVERTSQRGIIVGKKGAMLKEIGSAARRDIEVFLQKPVFLHLTVKVREAWRKNQGLLDRLGYRS